MNLVDGKILDMADCDAILNALNDRVLATLAKPRLEAEVVIRACDKLVASLDDGVWLPVMKALGLPAQLGKTRRPEARALFSGDALRHRLQKELGDNPSQIRSHTTAEGYTVHEQLLPLGVLLHIAAGNADGLPAFSVLEGLLTGNINILKLPAAEGGLSVRLLSALIAIEPALAEYIYVFDYSSKDMGQLKKLIEVADGVVVWGGIEAVSTFRSLLPVHVKLIEWGHKVSFAYVSTNGVTDDALYGIAANIASTGQLLCSSCQGIYLDTGDFGDVCAFCERFLPLLEKAVGEYAAELPVGLKAQAALQRRTAELESALNGGRVFKAANCSLIACRDRVLQPAMGFANAWVKALPQNGMMETLRPYKNYLQTAALVSAPQEEAALADLLLKSGVVRVCDGDSMSKTYSGAPHDGEYPLRRYMRVTTVEARRGVHP